MLIELEDYTLNPEKKGQGKGIQSCCFTIRKGDVWSINTDSINDAHLFFKGLATLSYPSGGTYRFHDEILNFSDYRSLLHIKKEIGYVTSSTALISNRSIRENLCIGQAYFGNDLSSTLTRDVMELCTDFGIEKIIEERPANLGVADKKSAMIIREFVKKPQILLIEYPEEFTSGKTMEVLIRVLRKKITEKMALVFLTDEDGFSRYFEKKILEINQGTVRRIDK